jgi:hypothetical protein
MDNLVTSLNAVSVDIANWTIVANGDVNLSGGFVVSIFKQIYVYSVVYFGIQYSFFS